MKKFHSFENRHQRTHFIHCNRRRSRMYLIRPICPSGRPPIFALSAPFLDAFHQFTERTCMTGREIYRARAIWAPYKSISGSFGARHRYADVGLKCKIFSSNFRTGCVFHEMASAQQNSDGNSPPRLGGRHEMTGISNLPTRKNSGGSRPFSGRPKGKDISEWNDAQDEHVRRRTGRTQRGKRTNDKIYALGRLLTRTLRHMATELNLNIRSDGYVAVHDLLNLKIKTSAGFPMCAHTVEDIKEAVKNDNKQRFGLLEENGQFLIRANQGHSIEVVDSERLLKPILSPEEVPVCVHGTYRKYLESIRKTGLSRMKRLHVHFATGLPNSGSVVSGMRSDCEILIFLDVQKALKDGMKLYLSENGVVLTEGFDGIVPTCYFAKIETWPEREPIN